MQSIVILHGRYRRFIVHSGLFRSHASLDDKMQVHVNLLLTAVTVKNTAIYASSFRIGIGIFNSP